jgi:hypothetical protein
MSSSLPLPKPGAAVKASLQLGSVDALRLVEMQQQHAGPLVILTAAPSPHSHKGAAR